MLILHNFRLQRHWNKKSARWTAHAKKVAKNYEYVKGILNRALKMRIHDKIGMRKKKEFEVDDPTNPQRKSWRKRCPDFNEYLNSME